MNPIYAHALMGGVLGVLFAVAITAPQRPSQTTDQTPQVAQAPAVAVHEANIVHADYAPPVARDMGSANATASGLKGHLSTYWSEKLVYNLEVGPSDPSRHEAFAAVVADPQRPVSVDFELKSALGQVLCDNQVVLKFDPRKSLKTRENPDSAAARELERETSNDVFRNEIGKDGKVDSISSEGTMPCSKQQYESAATWSLSSTFPNLVEQANRLSQPAVQQAAQKAPVAPKPAAQPVHVNRAWKEALVVVPPAPRAAPSTPSAPSAPSVQEPVTVETVATAAPPAPHAPDHELATVATPAFTFLIEGDDEIVDIDTTQKSIQTSAGKVFVVAGELAASDADSWTNDQVNVHYRCDQSASCTLSLADATVLHATLRSRHAMAQTELSMVSPDTTTPQSSMVDGLDQ